MPGSHYLSRPNARIRASGLSSMTDLHPREHRRTLLYSGSSLQATDTWIPPLTPGSRPSTSDLAVSPLLPELSLAHGARASSSTWYLLSSIRLPGSSPMLWAAVKPRDFAAEPSRPRGVTMPPPNPWVAAASTSSSGCCILRTGCSSLGPPPKPLDPASDSLS